LNRFSIAIRPHYHRSCNWMMLVVMVAAIIFVGPPNAWCGGQLKLTPHISARSEYDSNITYKRSDEIDDFIFIVNPGVDLVYSTERTSLSFSANVDLLRYVNEDQLNDEHYRINLGAQHMFTERLGFSVNGSYVADTTLDAELEEIGYITGRSNRERYSGGGGMSYRLSELSSMVLGYNRSRTNYDNPGTVDSESESYSLSYSRLLNDGRDTLSLSPYYSTNSSDTSDVYTYGFSAGLDHIFSERLTLSFSLGARYTETERKFQGLVLVTTPVPHLELRTFTDKSNNWGSTGRVALTYSGDQWSANFGFNKGLSYTSQGDAVDTDRLSAGLSYRISERLSSRVSVSFYRNTSEEEGRVDSRRYQVSPSLSYSLTENASLDFSYSFSYSEDDTRDEDNDIMRHRVVLSFRYNFPLEY
jgi:hypothetical protein